MTVFLDVYDVTNTTLIRTLEEPHAVSFLEDLTIPGYLQFQVDTAAADDLAGVVARRVVRVRRDATDLAAYVIEDLPGDVSDAIQQADGESLSTVTAQCRGLGAWFGSSTGGAVLYPAQGLEGRQVNPRMFGWTSQDFDDSGWGEVAGSRIGGRLSTAGWPDGSAVAFEPFVQGDRALYRRFLPASEETRRFARMYLAAAVDTRVEVWLDDEMVLDKPAGVTGLHFADIPYENIDHQLAVEVAGGSGRWGWTWVTLEQVTDADGNEQLVPDTVLRRTFDPDEFPAADTPWLSFEGGPVDWQTDPFDTTGWFRPKSDGPVSTAGWPDADAVAYAADAGRGRFRRSIVSDTAIAGATMTLVGSFTASVKVFIDGTEVLAKPPRTRGLFEATVDYPGTDFVLSVLVVSEDGGRFALTWEDSGSTLRRTYDPLEFPAADPWLYRPEDAPGVTVGFVADVALAEDGARHVDRPWTWTFDGNLDSAGQPWAKTFSRGFRVQEVGRLLDELTSIEGEPQFDPDGTFHLYVRRGEDRTGTVTLTSPASLSLTGRGPQATRWLYETRTGFGRALLDPAVEAEYGTMERFVQLGSDMDGTFVAQVVIDQLVRDGRMIDEVELEIPDDVTPFADLWVGDTVTCVGRDGTGPVRVTSLAATVDDDTGFVTWTATGVPADV